MDVIETTTLKLYFEEMVECTIYMSANTPHPPGSSQAIISDLVQRIGDAKDVFSTLDGRTGEYLLTTFGLPQDDPMMKKLIACVKKPSESMFDGLYNRLRALERERYSEVRDQRLELLRAGGAQQAMSMDSGTNQRSFEAQPTTARSR